MPPPPKSPTRLTGGTGALAGPADRGQRAGDRDVVDVVPGGRRPAARPAPSRSSARTPAAGCAPRTLAGRTRAARRRPGRNPSTSTSAASASRSSSASPAGSLRLIPTDRRPRPQRVGRGGRARPAASARSTRSTSAPRSARIMQPNGAGARLAISITRTPSSGPIGSPPPPRSGARDARLAGRSLPGAALRRGRLLARSVAAARGARPALPGFRHAPSRPPAVRPAGRTGDSGTLRRGRRRCARRALPGA